MVRKAKVQGLAGPFVAARVRDHAGDNLVIRIRDERRATELALGLGRLRGEDMAHLGLAALELAGAGLMKALGCAAVGLQLWHWVILTVRVSDNLLIIYEA